MRFFNTYEPVITIYRDLAPALAGAGFDVNLVISRCLYRDDKTPLEALSVQHESVRVTRFWSPFRIAKDRFAKTFTLVFYIVQMVFRSLFGRSAHVNVFLTQPPFSSVWGFVLKTVRRQKYACILMDIYPDVLIKDGILTSDGAIARLLRSMVVFSWKRADAIIVIGRCMRDYVAAAGVDASKIHVITNWNDESSVQPVEREFNSLLGDFGYEDKFVVLYSGNLGVSHQFEDIIKAADILKDREDIRFVVVGTGSRLKDLKRLKELGGQENVDFLPYQPFEKLHLSLSMAHVHYVCLRDGFTGLVVPSKTYPAMASGRPIIFSGEDHCEIACAIKDHHCGQVIEQGDAAGLAAAISSYRDDAELMESHGANALKAANEGFSRATCLQKYTDVFRNLCGPVPLNGRAP